MSKRITITVDDEHYACLQDIAKTNNLSVSYAVYQMLDEWIKMKALQMQVHEALAADFLDQAVGGTPN